MHQPLLGSRPQGKLFVVSAPAGTGKTTLVNMLLDEFPEAVAESCSSTTRHPRPSEIAGKDYDFLSVEEFERRSVAGEFLESVKVFGDYYGTRKEYVQKIQASGKHVMLVIDTQGAMQIKRQCDAVLIFVSPPSKEVLKERLFRRQTENPQAIEQRLSWAEKEIAMVPQYRYHIVNAELGVAYQILKSIVIAEENRV